MKRFALIFCLLLFYVQSANAEELLMKCYAPNSNVSMTFKLQKKLFFSQVYYRKAGRWKKWCGGSGKIKDDTGFCEGEAIGKIMVDFVDKRVVFMDDLVGVTVWECY